MEDHRTCGACEHWQQSGYDLGKEVGQCREQVHVMIHPSTLQILSLYATTQVDFPACSRHRTPSRHQGYE